MDRIEAVLEKVSDRLDGISVRLDQLAERHQALAETVEIIAGIQRENEAKLVQAIGAINTLARIAELRERRLDDLEGQ
jgi:RNA-binding protein YhbY